MKKHLALMASIALLCAGCAGASNAPPAPAKTSVRPSAQVSLSAGSGPQAPGGTVPATVGISWDQASKDRAVDVAQKAMADFARPSLEETQWANDLARWLTPQATADYSAVDPVTIPATRVTGPATLRIDESNGYGVLAAVPTNAGIYTLQLLRTGKDAPWRVNRFIHPAS
ncbi:hypothetical protein [Paenarthrobacter ureafaciens]|uniref:hypothetical protein n=1 Tax=Paenarthrobacter ureafaciens TaxID=37931 RepID=UPI0019177F92|nr:hypothetical protein [Paenarthrobacter ureafaciens]QQQ64346.1 hypothetical protein JHQ56_19935 [Paenarthrobacter ureafaciens]